MDNFIKILNVILKPFIWIVSLLFRFFKDIMKNIYGRVVAAVAGLILLYLIYLFLNK
jgi:hypothetical protein